MPPISKYSAVDDVRRVMSICVEGGGDGDDVFADVADSPGGEPVRNVARGVVGVAVADEREVQAGDALPRQDREVGVVGQPSIDLQRRTMPRVDAARAAPMAP